MAIESITVTPAVAEAVQKARCFACSRLPWEACQRPPDRACGREWDRTGEREAGPKSVEIKVVVRERG